MNRALFLDKDGTLISNVPYNVDLHKIQLYENAMEELKALQRIGYKIVIVTNQPGVGLGFYDEDDVKKVGLYLAELLGRYAIELDGFYYCPHHPDSKSDPYKADCTCRKPKNGMLLQAADDLNIELFGSWMVGDILHDVEAGNSAGCYSVLIDNGNETEWEKGPYRTPDFCVKDLKGALKLIYESGIDNRSHYWRV